MIIYSDKPTPELLKAVHSQDIDEIVALIQQGANINDADGYGNCPLIEATRSNQIEIVTLLLQHGADINQSDARLHTPLMVATYNGYLSLASILIKDIHCNIEARAHDGETALFLAVQAGKINSIHFLLNNGADIDTSDYYGSTILDIARKQHYIKIEKLIINALSTKDSKEKFIFAVRNGLISIVETILKETSTVIDVTDKYDATPLNIASGQGHIEIVKKLLNYKPNINASNLAKNTPLMEAVVQGNAAIVKKLLEHGANSNIAGEHDETPLMVAADQNRIDIVNLLLDYGADVNKRNEYDTALIRSVQHDVLNKDLVQTLVLHGANLFDQDRFGCNVFEIALESGHKNIKDIIFPNYQYRKLLPDTPSLNQKKNTIIELLKSKNYSLLEDVIMDEDSYAEEALCSLVEEGRKDFVEKILSYGVDINTTNIHGQTPLMIAVENNDSQMVEFLIENEADTDDLTKKYRGETSYVWKHISDLETLSKAIDAKEINLNIRNNEGWTPVMWVAFREDKKILSLLLTNNASINSQNKNGKTALMYAVKRGERDVIELLLQYDVDLDIKDNDGHTAIWHGANNGYGNEYLLAILLEHKYNSIRKQVALEPIIPLEKSCFFDTVKSFFFSSKQNNEQRIYTSHSSYIEHSVQKGNYGNNFDFLLQYLLISSTNNFYKGIKPYNKNFHLNIHLHYETFCILVHIIQKYIISKIMNSLHKNTNDDFLYFYSYFMFDIQKINNFFGSLMNADTNNILNKRLSTYKNLNICIGSYPYLVTIEDKDINTILQNINEYPDRRYSLKNEEIKFLANKFKYYIHNFFRVKSQTLDYYYQNKFME